MIKTQSVKIRQLLLLMAFLVCPLSLWAQNSAVSGIVTDSNNEPVIGASVAVKNTTTGVVTDMDGAYTIQAPANATLEFRYLGFIPKEEKVNGRTRINVVMEVDENLLDDVVVVGYGTQKKVTLTGAVAGVKGTELIQTKNENPVNMLTGKIAGVRVWQKSAEPGTYNASLDIRGLGSPLIVIDGIERSLSDYQRMNPSDIEDVSVLKDASSAIYGVKGAAGVILVTTKKGSSEGKTQVSYNGSYTLQQPSGMPVLADPYQTMTLYNERSMNNINGGTWIYQQSDFDDFRNGTRRAADWTSLLFSEVAPQTQHDVSIAGGNAKTQYYIGMGYFEQEGIFKSGDLNYNKYNLRSNITTEIIKGLKFELNLSGVADQRNTPYTSSVDIIRNYWRQGVLFPAYADPENTMLSYEGLDLEENTIAEMTASVSGFRKYEQKNFQSSGVLSYDFGTILPALTGLSAKAVFSFDYQQNNNTAYRKEYSQYMYNRTTDSYDEKLYNRSSPNQLRRDFYSKQQIQNQYLLNYDRTFNGLHKVTGLFGLETQTKAGDQFYVQQNLAYASPYLIAGVKEGELSGANANDIYNYASNSVIGRANYAFADRYIAEVQFRHDGYSQLAPHHQWKFFPSGSLAWRVSEEPLFKSVEALSVVNQLKLRASYGSMGDYGSVHNEWLSGYYYPASSDNAENGYYNHWAPGYIFGDNFIFGASSMPISNLLITWSTMKTFDAGVDFEGWNGLFGFSFDYFSSTRSGILERRNGEVPSVLGATAPYENLNSERLFGLDLELNHRNKIGDLRYRVKAIGTITRKKNLTSVNQGPYGNSYDQWRHDNLTNRYQGVQFGYTGAGRYEDWNDIRNYSIYHERDVLPGDYKYEDWNGDGEINGLDEHPYAYDQTPWLNYSLNMNFDYKKFDLNILFQGSALGSMEYTEPLYSIWGSNGGGTLEQYLDRWHPTDPTVDPYDPSIEWEKGYYGFTGHYPNGNSSFNRVSTAYLRLKSIELGYTLPKVKALSNANLRVFANAYNLFTLTGVKFVDPEHPDSDLGRLYPLNKTYTLGVNLTF
jgi:TonB-linked SusC/RagA family outer membrane protein